MYYIMTTPKPKNISAGDYVRSHYKPRKIISIEYNTESDTESASEESYEKKYILKNRYVIDEDDIIGSGAFGTALNGYDKKTKKHVCIKMETIESRRRSQVCQEKHIMTHLNTFNFIQIPKIYDYICTNEHRYLVMEKHGKSLSMIRKENDNRPIDLKCVLMLADILIHQISLIHNCGILHLDIKPGNIITDISEQLIYIIDFGLSKRYKLKGKHIKFSKSGSIVGTMRYMSKNIHQRHTASRRDDLYSIGYLLVEMMLGQLPWSKIFKKNTKLSKREKHKLVLKYKREYDGKKLCSKLPRCFVKYFNYVDTLKFDEKPNYLKLRVLFLNEMEKNNYDHDNMWDW